MLRVLEVVDLEFGADEPFVQRVVYAVSPGAEVDQRTFGQGEFPVVELDFGLQVQEDPVPVLPLPLVFHVSDVEHRLEDVAGVQGKIVAGLPGE